METAEFIVVIPFGGKRACESIYDNWLRCWTSDPSIAGLISAQFIKLWPLRVKLHLNCLAALRC